MKKTKKIISLLLTIQMLFACALVPSVMAAYGIVETPGNEGNSSEELFPMMARRCTYKHYEITSSWTNGNVQTITYWTVDEQGNRVGAETWTVSYPETGADAMGGLGTPGGFNGCKCPNCT